MNGTDYLQIVLKILRISQEGGLHIDETLFGLFISQWLPCPSGCFSLDGSLVKSYLESSKFVIYV